MSAAWLRCSAERYAHGGADTDGGRAANNHGADDFGDGAIIFGEHVGFFQRQLRLIEKANAGIGPFKGRNHRASILSSIRRGRFG